MIRWCHDEDMKSRGSTDRKTHSSIVLWKYLPVSEMPFITMNAQEFNPNADKVSVKINKHQLGGKDKVRR